MTASHRHRRPTGVPSTPAAPVPVRDWRDRTRVEHPLGHGPVTQHLVVGLDDHGPSHRALAYAIELATSLNAHLDVVHVVDIEDIPVDPELPDFDEQVLGHLERARAETERLMAACTQRWTYHCARGDPANLLRTVARENDATMILVGSPRHRMLSWVERLLGTSVSGSLVRHGHRTVVVVPDAA